MAKVHGRPEGILISLHNIILRTPIPSNLVCIAVSEAVADSLASVFIDSGWTSNEIHSSVTSALNLAQVNIVLHASAEEFGSEKRLSGDFVWVRLGREVQAAISIIDCHGVLVGDDRIEPLMVVSCVVSLNLSV